MSPKTRVACACEGTDGATTPRERNLVVVCERRIGTPRQMPRWEFDSDQVSEMPTRRRRRGRLTIRIVTFGASPHSPPHTPSRVSRRGALVFQRFCAHGRRSRRAPRGGGAPPAAGGQAIRSHVPERQIRGRRAGDRPDGASARRGGREEHVLLLQRARGTRRARHARAFRHVRPIQHPRRALVSRPRRRRDYGSSIAKMASSPCSAP